ncbi:hypothetical protein [Arthrobacter sp. Z1-9]
MTLETQLAGFRLPPAWPRFGDRPAASASVISSRFWPKASAAE